MQTKPKKFSKVLPVAFTEELYAELETVTWDLRKTRSELTRIAVVEFIQRHRERNAG